VDQIERDAILEQRVVETLQRIGGSGEFRMPDLGPLRPDQPTAHSDAGMK